MVRKGLAAGIVAVVVQFGTAAAETYHVVPGKSELVVEVGRAGFLKMLGHDHHIRADRFSGTVEWDPETPESATFRLEIEAASLVVADEELSDDDRAKVQSDMETQALALSQHPSIVFHSERVEHRGGHRLRVHGVLSLRGTERELTVPLAMAEEGDTWVASGTVELESKDWGVPQISALGGSVKTKTKLELSFRIALAGESGR